MKYGITYNPYHARSVRPNSSRLIFTNNRKVTSSFSPRTDFSIRLLAGYFVCLYNLRGAERHAIVVVRVVVVTVAVVVDIAEVGRVGCLR